MNESFTMEMFEVLSHKNDEWSWYHLSQHKNTTLEYIESHPELPWEWVAISGNPNLTIEFIEKHEEKDCGLWSEISKNPNMTLDIIEKHIDKPWKWSSLSDNPNLTWEFIEKHSDKKWCWATISRHKNITMDIIQNNPDKPWHPFPVKQNPNVDIVFFIRKFKHFRWEALFHSKSMSMHQFKWFLAKYENGDLGDQDFMWRIKDVWRTVSRHPNITPDDIEKVFTNRGIGPEFQGIQISPRNSL